MSKKNYHSVPSQSGWAVKKAGAPTPLSTHRTQAAAESATRQLAKANKVEAVFHKLDGRIKDKDSFGNDPFPPKDRKH